MRRALSGLLAGVLAVSAIAAVAPGDVTAELSARDGRTAVSTRGDSDTLFLGGEVPAGSEPTATLQALDHADAVVQTWDVSNRVVVTDGTVSGTVPVLCFYVPDCSGTDPESPEREAALAALGGYRLQLTVEDVSDLSGTVEFDPHKPLITRYALTSPTTIEVRFSEDVTDPDGDAARDWEVDDLRQVVSVQGTGDTRVLTLLTPYEDGDTPEVFYLPTPSLDPQNLPNRPYVDRAGNELDADGRLGLAADEIPPPVPSIDAIEGTDVTYESDDRAVPVLGNDETPEVVVGDVPDGVIAELWFDADDDGAFEPDGDDVLVGEATGDGSGSVTIEADVLPADGVHRYYARSRDQAACDPDDPDSETCANTSGRSQEARYDLDTVAPTPVVALSSTSTIAVQFSEPLVGADGAGQWTVTNPGGGAVTVTSVSGAGDTRTLRYDGGPVVDGATLAWTAPGSDPYRDEHGNVLTGFPLAIDAAELPLLTVDAADAVEGDPPLVPGNPLDPAPTLDYTLVVSGLPAGDEVEVAYRTVAGTDGDATPGDDYEPVDGTVTITGADDGTGEAVVSVAVARDLLDEFDEAVSFEVRNVDDAAPQFTLPGDAATLTTDALILDDDDPVVATISPASADVAEGGSVELSVRLDAASGKPVTIDWATAVAADPAEGEAGAADVPAQSGSVTIPAGEQGATFQVEVADDGIDEPDETFTVDLAAPDGANATLGDPASATLTILDDDLPVPTLTVEPGSVGEGDAALPILSNAQLPFTFHLSEAPDQPIEVSWTTDDSGTAGEDVDFTGASGTVRFEADETEQQVLVDVLDDDLDEDDETVALVVADPAGAVLAGADDGASATFLGTITDDDPLPTLRFADDSETQVVTEGDTATLTVELGAVSGRDVSVDWATVDETTDRADLAVQSGTVVVPEGETSASFQVTTLDDDEPESDEVVRVELSAPANAELGDPATSRLTIADDEVVLPTISIVAEAGNEDPGLLPPFTSPTPVTFTVELDGEAPGDVTVRYRTTNGGDATAESDFTAVSDVLTIPQGETSGTIEVEVLDDELDEPDELVELELSQPVNARFPDAAPTLSAMGVIIDDDPVVLASFGDDVTVDEGETAVVAVLLDTASGKRVQLDYRTVDQSAGEGDYVATSGRITFEPGETSTTVSVPTRDDAAVEGEEDFRLELSVVDPDTAEIGDGEAVVTITDNDVDLGDEIVVSLSGATVEEGDPVGPFPALVPTRSLDFVVSLSEPATGPVELSYTSAAGTATPGEDVELEDGTVEFEAGQQEATISLGTYTDLLDEFDETVVLTVQRVSGDVTVPDGELSRTGRILDDDPPVAVAFAPDSREVEVDEGDTATLTVELGAVSGKDVTVTWTTSHNGSASTDDVPRQRGEVTVPAGSTTATFEVTTLDDELGEGDEDLSVVLSDPRNGQLAGSGTTARLVVLDDEVVVPVLRIEGGTVDEGEVGPLGAADPGLSSASEGEPGMALAVSPLEQDLVFTVTLDEAAEQDATVSWTTTDLGTATPDSDFVADAGTLTIAAGETQGEVLVDVLPDDLDEYDETVVVRFSDPQGARFEDGVDAVDVEGTILDDDPLVTVDLGEDQTVSEGERATFEVTLSEASGKDITLRHRTEDDSATAGDDYRGVDETLTIPAGETGATFTVQTLTDTLVEDDEQAAVVLSVVEDDMAELGRSTGTLTITDGDTGGGPGGGDQDGAPDGSDGATGSDGVADGSDDGDPRAGELPATGGGIGLGMVALAALLARRRRD